jgi:hypothetical protein
MDEDNLIPLYYCVRRGLTDEQLDAVSSLLCITPVLACVIFDPHDAQAALHLTSETMMAPSEALAHKLARKISMLHGQPLLVMGSCDFIDAYFLDGSHLGIGAHA